jgi:hypothetical protein
VLQPHERRGEAPPGEHLDDRHRVDQGVDTLLLERAGHAVQPGLGEHVEPLDRHDVATLDLEPVGNSTSSAIERARVSVPPPPPSVASS